MVTLYIKDIFPALGIRECGWIYEDDVISLFRVLKETYAVLFDKAVFVWIKAVQLEVLLPPVKVCGRGVHAGGAFCSVCRSIYTGSAGVGEKIQHFFASTHLADKPAYRSVVQEYSCVKVIVEVDIKLKAAFLHNLKMFRLAASGVLVCAVLLFPAADKYIFFRNILLQHLGHLPHPPFGLGRVYVGWSCILLQVHPLAFVKVYGGRIVGQVCIVNAVAGHILAAGQLAELF